MYKLEQVAAPLNQEELEFLVRLEEEAFGRGGLSFFEIPAFALFGRIYYFYYKGEIAGHAIVTRYFDREAAFLYSFALRPSHRNKGLGGKFLELLLDSLKNNFASIYLTVDPKNEPALRLYRKAGFNVVELVPDFYGKGEDRYIMLLVFQQREAL